MARLWRSRFRRRIGLKAKPARHNLDDRSLQRGAIHRAVQDELIEIADLVTEMELIKHPFRSGVKAQAGIEF